MRRILFATGLLMALLGCKEEGDNVTLVPPPVTVLEPPPEGFPTVEVTTPGEVSAAGSLDMTAITDYFYKMTNTPFSGPCVTDVLDGNGSATLSVKKKTYRFSREQIEIVEYAYKDPTCAGAATPPEGTTTTVKTAGVEVRNTWLAVSGDPFILRFQYIDGNHLLHAPPEGPSFILERGEAGKYE